MTPVRSTPLRLSLGLVALVVAGCQGSGDLSGKVSYQNKPVVWGTVLVVASDGTIHQANIERDGSYSAKGVRVGEAALAVNSPDPTAPLIRKPEVQPLEDPAEARQRAELKRNWFPLPDRYGDPKGSGLTHTVGGGMNARDIELR